MSQSLRSPRHAFIQCHLAPIYVLRPSNSAEADLEASLRALEDYWQESTEAFVLVIDVAGLPPPSLRARQLITEHDVRTSSFKKSYCRGMAYVMDSMLMRGAFKAIVWISPPTYPVNTFSRLDDAIVWAHEKMK